MRLSRALLFATLGLMGLSASAAAQAPLTSEQCGRAAESIRQGTGRWVDPVGGALARTDTLSAACRDRLVAAFEAADRRAEAAIVHRAATREAPPARLRDADAALQTQLTSGRVRGAVPASRSVDELMLWVALLTEIAPGSERSGTCDPVEEWSSRTRGAFMCNWWDPNQPQDDAEVFVPIPVEAFVWERRGGRYRVVASFAAGHAYMCEEGRLLQARALEPLDRSTHGVDGWMLTLADGWDEVPVGEEYGADTREDVFVCTRERGACAQITRRRDRCTYGDEGPRRCVQSYEAEVAVRRGRLEVRAVRGTLPAGLREGVDLSQIQEQPVRAGASRMHAGCRVEVHDTRPPLNVRARPQGQAPVVATLDNATPVTVVGRADRRWIEISAPVRGFVWSRNLRRVCTSD